MTEKAQKTRAAIIDAAIAAFSEKGFHGARIDEIAKIAGVNKERIYAYFDGKRGLFAEVLAESYRDIGLEEERLASQATRESLTSSLLSTFYTIHQVFPHFWRLIAWENLDGGRDSRGIKGVKRYESLRLVYDSAQEEGILPRFLSFDSYMFVLLAVTFFSFSNQKTMAQSMGLDLSDPETRNRIAADIEKLFLCAARGEGNAETTGRKASVKKIAKTAGADGGRAEPATKRAMSRSPAKG